MQKRKKILIVDDFQPLLEEVSEFLAMEGYHVLTASDGAEGVQKAVQHKPDLIICDVEMPNMNGYEVFKTLNTIPATKGTPFIFATARAQANDFRVGLKLGADDYITKPFELEELIFSINKRFEKVEQIRASGENKFNMLADNPLLGVFYYLDKRFVYLNDKFEQITGYSLTEINRLDLKDVLVGESKKTVNMICMCLKGLHETVHLKFTVYNKSKQLRFLELFARYIEQGGLNAIIGSVVEITEEESTKRSGGNSGSSSDIDVVMQYLISVDKDDIAKEVKEAEQLINFEKKAQQSYVQKNVKLSQREMEILSLICNGFTNNEIAEQLFISNRTVENHRANLLQKTGTKNTATLVAFAISNKLVSM